MVQIEETNQVTRNGMEGTIYTLLINGFSKTRARIHAKAAMTGRFPVNIGKVEVVSSEKTEGEFPGLPAHKVRVFMPHNNPSNPSRAY